MSKFITPSLLESAQKHLSFLLALAMVFQAFGPGLFALQIAYAQETPAETTSSDSENTDEPKETKEEPKGPEEVKEEKKVEETNSTPPPAPQPESEEKKTEGTLPPQVLGDETENLLEDVLDLNIGASLLQFGPPPQKSENDNQNNAVAKIDICHLNGQSETWNVLNVDDNGWEGHGGHSADYLYAGPHDSNSKDAGVWCADNAPETPSVVELPTGAIEVCKIVLDHEGNNVLGPAGTTFTIPWLDEDYEGAATDVLAPDAEFTTPLVHNKTVFGNEEGQCLTYNNVADGKYYYGEEIISPDDSNWATPIYHDDYKGEVDSYDDLQPFNKDLDAKYDNFDGVINVKNGETRTLIVVNQMKEAPVQCIPGVELIENGSFENPKVTDPADWDVFTSGLDWVVAWMNPAGAPDTASLELHAGVNGWLATDGDQYAELDGDWGGPGHGGSEDASTLIYQDIPTVPGETYTLKFSFKPRPDANIAAQNILGVLWQGDDVDVLDSTETDGDWTEFTYPLIADNSGLSRIQFEDRGTPDAMGTFLDNVSLKCEEPKDDPEPCVDGPAWAYEVEDENQGLRGNGTAVLEARSDSEDALEENDGDFFSLGEAGSLTIKFENYVENGVGHDLEFFEITNGNYPEETASVEVSQDGITWKNVGTVTNKGTSTVDIDSTGWASIQYVRVTDTTDFSLHDGAADGYDIDAIYAVNALCEQPEDPTPLDLSTVTMCKVDDEKNPLSGWTLMLLGAKVDDLSVNSETNTSANKVSSSLLVGDYIVKADGTFEYRGGTNLTADARFSEHLPADASYGGAFSPWATGTIGWLHLNGDNTVWGDVFNPGHTYYAPLSLAVDGVAEFYIGDNNYSDNNGSLNVEIWSGYIGVTGDNDGCVVFDEVPYGTYTADEILQDGWKMVSGTGDVTIDSPDVTITIVNEEEDGGSDPDPIHTSELIIVNPDDMKGWAFAQESATANGSMVTGPLTTPLGVGSANFIVDDTGGEVLGVAYPETRLDAITNLQYSTFKTSGASALAVALQFNIDADLTDADVSWQGRLVYEPYHTKTVNTGVWETWDPMDNDALGNWWFSNVTLAANTGCAQANPCTWSEVTTALPDGGVHSTFGGILFKAGSGWIGGFDGNVDEFVITVKTNALDTHTTTYDFEPTESTPNGGGDGDGDNNSTQSRSSGSGGQRILGATDSTEGEVAGATTDLPGLPNTGNGQTTGIAMTLLALAFALAGINFVGLRTLRKN
jgi:hypothetical protein